MEPDWYELPVFYFTNPAAVLGPDDEVAAPAGHVGARLRARGGRGDRRRVPPTWPPTDWLDVVAGFTVMNDWSARDLQRREMALGLGPAKGKDFATSLGPVLVTPEELLDADGVPDGDDGRPRQRRGVEPRRAGRPPLRLGRPGRPRLPRPGCGPAT